MRGLTDEKKNTILDTVERTNKQMVAEFTIKNDPIILFFFSTRNHLLGIDVFNEYEQRNGNFSVCVCVCHHSAARFVLPTRRVQSDKRADCLTSRRIIIGTSDSDQIIFSARNFCCQR